MSFAAIDETTTTPRQDAAWLTVLVPMFSSSSAAAMPPHSTTALKTCSRRRSMSESWPMTARGRGVEEADRFMTTDYGRPSRCAMDAGFWRQSSTATTVAMSPFRS